MRKRSWWAALGTIMSIVLVACQRHIPVDGKLANDIDNPECPHVWALPDVSTPTVTVPNPLGVPGGPPTITITLAGKFLPGQRVGVPEFHDCQKLRTYDATTHLEGYGPLAGVFARDSLEFVTAADLEAPVALALVFLPQGGTYPELGLTKTFACVLVRTKAGAREAWIIPTDIARACPSSLVTMQTAAASPVDLRVLDPPAGMAGADIPPVARWDWDESTHSQYIGVRCGEAWCEIGHAAFQSSASHDPGVESGDARRGFALRGAYDEQRLADFATGVLTPAMNLGTVVPTADLTGFAATRASEGTWVPVAKIFLAPETGGYGAEFNFASTTAVAPGEVAASTVSLCIWSDAHACPPGVLLDVSRCNVEDGTTNRWIARIDRPGKGVKYLCVWYRKHDLGFTMPAIVRWRWRANDETIWISCPTGCCEVNAKKGGT